MIIWDGRASNNFVKSGTTYTNGSLVYSMSQEISRPSAFDIVDDPLRQYGKVFRIDIDQTLDFLASTNKGRCELQTPTTGAHADNGAELWLLTRFMLPIGFNFVRNGLVAYNNWPCVVWQIHDGPGGIPRPAPFHFLLVGDKLEFRQSMDASSEVRWYSSTAIIGHWYSLVAHVYWENTTAENGLLELWVDGHKIKSTIGLNCYSTNNSANYPKAPGLYYGQGRPPDVTNNTIYSWGLMVGNADYDTYDEFMEGCGQDDVELEPYVTRGMSPVS